MAATPTAAGALTGRFAPSPTGPLHFGSLVAATGSYAQARSNGGRWLVRMEDLDTPRNAPGAADRILRTLEAFGFEWDDDISYQSQRLEHYRDALDRLAASGLSFGCACTRKSAGSGAYPGTCRAGLPAGIAPRAVRLKVTDGPVSFRDAIAGHFEQDVAACVGDFVVHRADGIVAYHLAVAVDDADQGVTEVVRGADLLDSTPRQLLVLDALALPRPSYAHLPVAIDPYGAKLSKQTHAPDVLAGLEGTGGEPSRANTLALALEFLGHAPPAEATGSGLTAVWQWAVRNWRLDRVPRHPVALAPAMGDER